MGRRRCGQLTMSIKMILKCERANHSVLSWRWLPACLDAAAKGITISLNVVSRLRSRINVLLKRRRRRSRTVIRVQQWRCNNACLTKAVSPCGKERAGGVESCIILWHFVSCAVSEPTSDGEDDILVGTAPRTRMFLASASVLKSLT